jgi:FkbM family methyltransferase
MAASPKYNDTKKSKAFSRLIRSIRWRIFPLTLAVKKWMRLRVVKSVYGVKLVSNYEDKTFQFYLRGSYGYFYWNRIAEIREPFIFLDIGANQGLYAIGAAMNESCVVSYAFEPMPSTHEFLVRNIRINRVEEKCVPIERAVGRETGDATLIMKPNHSGGATFSRRASNSNTEVLKRRIKVINYEGLNEFIGSLGYRIVVKVDVEGFEREVIEQLNAASFSQSIMEIFFEVDEAWVDVDEMIAYLRKAGFTRFEKIGSGNHYDMLALREG